MGFFEHVWSDSAAKVAVGFVAWAVTNTAIKLYQTFQRRRNAPVESKIILIEGFKKRASPPLLTRQDRWRLFVDDLRNLLRSLVAAACFFGVLLFTIVKWFIYPDVSAHVIGWLIVILSGCILGFAFNKELRPPPPPAVPPKSLIGRLGDLVERRFGAAWILLTVVGFIWFVYLSAVMNSYRSQVRQMRIDVAEYFAMKDRPGVTQAEIDAKWTYLREKWNLRDVTLKP